MRAWLRPLIVAAGLWVPVSALAQTAAPAVEIGVDAAALLIPDRAGVAPAPRLVINFDGRNALQMTAAFHRGPVTVEGDRIENDLYLAVFKRVVLATPAMRVFTTLGTGLERTRISVPEIVFGSPPIVIPASTFTEVVPLGTVGAGLEVRLGRRAAVVLESSWMMSDRFGGRVSAGVLVPVGGYPPRSKPLPASVPWATLAHGSRAWITADDGREIDGEVVARTAARLDVRTAAGLVSFTPAEIRAIDATDPIRNGVVLGAKIGGFGAILPSVFITFLVCAFAEDCGVGPIIGANAVIIGMGTGLGAALGALSDSLRERRAPLYRRGGSTAVSVAPVAPVQGRGLGAGLLFGWK